jgi:hypothetical protein
MRSGSSGTAIIITGRKRGGPRQLADYLTDKGENEKVHVRHIGCFVARTVSDALAEMWAVADGCKAKDFLYHATINPKPGNKLSQKQWREAVDRLEKNLNLVGHQRVVVEHVKHGRTHYHVVWNRVNPQTGRVKKLSFDRRTLRATALQIGTLFNLTPTSNKDQSYKRGHIERGKRTGIDPKIVKAEVTALWNKSKSGKEFAAALAKRGYILARGDKGKFVLIDRAGSTHGLTRRIHGATAKTIKRGLADIDIKTLPSIAEARATVRVKYPRPKLTGKTRHANSAHRVRSSHRAKPPSKTSRQKSVNRFGRTGRSSPIRAWPHYGFYLATHPPVPTTKSKPLTTNSQDSPRPVSEITRNAETRNQTHNNPASQRTASSSSSAYSKNVSKLTLPPPKPIPAPQKPQEQQPQQPFRPPMRNTSGWPPAAIADWKAWGHKDPEAFFKKWPELASGNPSPGGPR